MTDYQSWSRSKLFDTLIVLLKDFFLKRILKKSEDANKAFKITQNAKKQVQIGPD